MPTVGKWQRERGAKLERAIVHLLEAVGIHCQRVPNSGSAGGNFGADIEIYLPGCETPCRVEVKRRQDGFRQDRKWLEECDALIKGSMANGDDATITFKLKDFLGETA